MFLSFCRSKFLVFSSVKNGCIDKFQAMLSNLMKNLARATYGTAQELNKVVHPLFQYAGIKNIMRT